MKKILFSLFSIFILLAYPLQAIEIDKSMLNDISKEISQDLHVPTIVGDDDRQEITGKATGPEKAVVVIESEYGECSGALVAPNIVLTAAHCLIDDDGNYVKGLKVYAVGMPSSKTDIPSLKIFTPNSKTDIPPALKDPLSQVRKDTLSNYLYSFPHANAKELWVSDQYIQAYYVGDLIEMFRNDYGFVILDYDLGIYTKWLELKIPHDEELTHANIMVIGRGIDKPFLSLWKSPGQIKKLRKYVFYHNARVTNGNSGSPIFKENDTENIIALFTFDYGAIYLGLINYTKGGLRIRQEMIDALNGLQGSFRW
ncbi:MAG: trypsin-like serine protease [Elusimicrobiaceae bacterium]|nr:trypsin-like serine protease [Elusimicrobiaceae bacterium]